MAEVDKSLAGVSWHKKQNGSGAETMAQQEQVQEQEQQAEQQQQQQKLQEISVPMRVLSMFVKAANKIVRRDDFTVRRWMGNLEEVCLPACSWSLFGVCTKDVRLNDDNQDPWVRVFVPRACSERSSCPVVIYCHGGGFAVLRPDFFLYDIFCRRMAKASGCIVVSVNYRRSPEFKYPVAHEDCFQVLKWLASSSLEDGILPPNADLSKCFLAGDSAGGNLAFFTSCKAALEDLSPLRVRGNILIQPYFGSEERTQSEVSLRNGPIIDLEMTDWYWTAYLPPGENKDHPLCNVFGPRSAELGYDVSRLALPPSLVIVGEYDLLQDAQLKFANGMKAADKSVQVLVYKAVHCFHIFYRSPAAQQVLVDVTEFIKEQ